MGNMAKIVDLVDEELGRSVEILVESRSVLGSLELLEREFHWSERIIDLVRHLSRHGTPSHFAFATRQSFGGFSKRIHHPIVVGNHISKLVRERIVDMLAILPCLVELELLGDESERRRHSMRDHPNNDNRDYQ